MGTALGQPVDPNPPCLCCHTVPCRVAGLGCSVGCDLGEFSASLPCSKREMQGKLPDLHLVGQVEYLFLIHKTKQG